MTGHVNLLLEERHAHIWTDDDNIIMWSLTIGYVRRVKRRWRMIANLLTAYKDVLAGHYDTSVSQAVIAGEDAHLYHSDEDYKIISEDEMRAAKVNFRGQVRKVHTPFLARPEVVWAEDPSADDPRHIFVDASFFLDGPKGLPVSSYAIRVDGEVEVFTLNTALSSVDAEMQALQHAIVIAYQKSQNDSQRYTVFSDCSVALTKIVLRHESDVLQFLGESVFVQWTSGHFQAVPGMVDVDMAARERVRELAGQY